MIDLRKPIREINPAEMSNACALAEGTLVAYRNGGVSADTMALSFLVNLSGLCVADLCLDEETFLARCKEQFNLYLEFQLEQIEKKTGKMSEQ